jgi:MFS family permease
MATQRPLGPGFLRLTGASGLSNTADGIFQVALPLLAAELTRSPGLVAVVALAQRLPWLLFALVAGALADRLDRRKTMVSVQLMRVVVLGGLAVASGFGLASIPLLVVAALVLGFGETLFDTAAQSAITAVVDKDDLSRANGRLFAVELSANLFVGPPLGGIIAGLASFGIALAFGVSATLFAGAAALLALIHGVFKPVRDDDPAGEPAGGVRRMSWLFRRLYRDVVEGLRYLFGHRLLRTLGIMTGVSNLANTAVFSVLVLYAVGPESAMGLSTTGFGVLMATLGVGSVIGSLLAARTERWIGRSNVLMLTLVVGAIANGTPALTADPLVIGAAFALGSVGIVMWNVVTVSLRQRITPDHLLGRMNAAYRLLAWGSMPLGAALGGFVAEAFSLRAVFATAAVLGLSLLALRPLVSEREIAAAEPAGVTA